MSIIGKILDIFGPGGNNNFYARDFRNAYTFRPDQNPPRQKFQGYVSFVVNRSLYGSTLYGNDINSEFRIRLGSLVRTASLPEVEFKTETKNSYNRKRIVNTGVEYQPVDIKVFDTINNEWLMLFMKYFSYHYMNPRNKSYNDRDVGEDIRYASTEDLVRNSNFGKDGGDTWNSNAYGYNINELANFFERIDYVLYHGNKGIQYSLINPVLTRFRTSDIDYSSGDVMEFDMTFEYESFTIYKNINFGLTDFDVARFENARGFKGPAFQPMNIPILLEERELKVLGEADQLGNLSYKRTFQTQPEKPQNPTDPQTDPGEVPGVTVSDRNQTDPGDVASSGDSVILDEVTVTGTRPNSLPSVYGDRATFAAGPAKEKGFIEGLLGNIADSALTAAIHGTSIKNAVVSTAVGGVVQGITDVIKTPVRGSKNQPTSEEENATASTAEKTVVTPSNEGGFI